MKTFKLLMVVVITITFINTTHSQEVNREIGVRSSGLTDFNFIYKKQVAENKFRRYRIGGLSLAASNSLDSRRASLAFGIGTERRKPIDSKLNFIHGFEPSIFTSFTRSNRSQFVGRLNLGYTLGFHLNVTDQFGINIESIPGIGLSIQTIDNDVSLGQADLNFNSTQVSMTFVYRFNK